MRTMFDARRSQTRCVRHTADSGDLGPARELPKGMNFQKPARTIAVAVTLLASSVARQASADAQAADPYAAARATLTSASAELHAHFRDVQRRNGDAVDLQGRIDGDLATVLQPPPTPFGWTLDEYVDAYTHIATLDASLVDQLSTGVLHDAATVRGVDDILVKSPVDGTLQPVALFVPESYDPSKPAPFVVFLHGRGLTEAETLGVPFVRDLAEESGAIVAAPFARGDIQYADPAPADVYATVDAVEKAFNVDRGRVYLGGYSMGGFGVFEVGPAHADVWTALLCVSGSLTNEDRDAVVRSFRNKTVYVVSGVKDDNVPHRWSQITVRWLRESNIATRFYADPEGTHSMATFRPSLRAAWNDMLEGIRADSGAISGGTLGSLPPLSTDTRTLEP